MTERWRFWIDRGGTFTDCIGRAPDGTLRVLKLLSSDDAPLLGIRRLLGLADDAPIPPCEVRMGTTLATNALLTRTGAPTALVITEGFEDLPLIRDQTRPELFALRIERPPPLAAAVVGVPHRGGADGAELARGVDPEALRAAIPDEIESAAVVVMHGPRVPALERELGQALAAIGIAHISLSHEVDAERGLLARADTTVADAYLTPLLTDYVAHLRRQLPGSALAIMQSSGALADAGSFRGRHAVLSGPAGGVVALGWLARRLASTDLDDDATGDGAPPSAPPVIGFDMGGTSTDVCRWHGGFDLTYEASIAGVHLRAPMMAIHTVAAGGGSICRYDGSRLSVGPESAGALPGPLCYGRDDAREPTLTDVNVALGRLPADRFPFPLDEARARAAIEALAARVGRPWSEVARGLCDVAVESMADAIRRVTVARGHDAREHALVVFGGAGGQHACALARRLGVRRVIAHPLAGVFSALGMGVADVGWHGEADVGTRRLDDGLLEAIAPTFDALEARGRGVLDGDAGEVHATRRVDLAYEGTETPLSIAIRGGAAELLEDFTAAHRARFGYARDAHPVVARTARLELVRPSPAPTWAVPAGTAAPRPRRHVRAYMDHPSPEEVPLYVRDDLGAGARVDGPALIVEDTGVLVIERGFRAHVGGDGCVELIDRGAPASRRVGTDVDPIRLEIFANAFMSIAEQMGVVLQRTALSTNIRDRLDYSCAVFDAAGGLVANAPHIPVHLGAMGETVLAVHRAHPDPRPGDVFVSNDPAAGGSHLPDLTVVSPIHDAAGTLRFFVASRGHHADVGGTTPGSMPPFSRTLDEEGAVFRALRVVSEGRFDRHAVLAVLRGATHPARRPLENLADLEAQIAANREGARLIDALCARYGVDVVGAYMGHVQDDGARKVGDAIEALPDGARVFEDALDDGALIRVRVTITGRAIDVDFAGTSAELEDSNLNAPRAVTVAAVLYVLRALVAAPIPLNAGCLRPVRLHVPARSLLDPGPTRAVAGGNVETSQRICDVLLGALGLAAASQGTMNNVTFGDARFGYYETLAGGAGAGPGFEGASAVHTHMTNSRVTDPEVLEDRFPIRLARFAVRRGSGGEGRFRGGDGLVREYELLAPLSFSILSERRERAPFGLDGGGPGACGVNRHGDRAVGGRASFDAAAGDHVTIETPGGGAYSRQR